MSPSHSREAGGFHPEAEKGRPAVTRTPERRRRRRTRPRAASPDRATAGTATRAARGRPPPPARPHWPRRLARAASPRRWPQRPDPPWARPDPATAVADLPPPCRESTLPPLPAAGIRRLPALERRHHRRRRPRRRPPSSPAGLSGGELRWRRWVSPPVSPARGATPSPSKNDSGPSVERLTIQLSKQSQED